MKITPKQYAISLYETTKNVDEFKMEKRIKNFVSILKKNNDLSLADKIKDEYNKHHRNQKNISKIEIISSNKLDSEILNRIIQKFENQIEVEEKIDESLINGIVIKINDDVLIDGSVKRKLEDLRKELV
ncbi:MAG: ATP synthase F1 subunit delta [Candidatus Pacebacteria bacterium]|nr:ATP synthase F1 subunit delta [Candidatus Paceibacterota bacterium]